MTNAQSKLLPKSMDDEICVETFWYGKKMYYIDADNNIYEPNNLILIGKLVETEPEDEDEDEDVCYGKHCDKKSCLKLATGWNRLWGGVADKRFEVNLYCDDCFEQDCFEKCEACCVVYPMTSLNYRTGGLFGEHCGNNLYCGACCKDIEKRMTLPDEDELV
jgi:hypothetical protein